MPDSESTKEETEQKVETYSEALKRDFFRRFRKASFLVEIATLGVVAWYAGEAHRQNVLMTASLAQQVLGTRPIMYQNGVKATERTTDGIPSKVKVKIRNFGKSLAATVGTIGHIFVVNAGEPAPIDPECREGAELPSDAGGGAVAVDEFTEFEWTPAHDVNLSDVNNGKVLYAVGCVYYFGLDRTKTYYTDICVFWAPKAAQDFQSCAEKERNRAD